MGSIIELKNEVGQLAGAAAAIYTCPAGKQARIISASACNDTTSVVAMTFYLVPSGGAAGVTNLLINARNLPNSGTDPLNEVNSKVLEAGDAIHGFAGTADQVTYALGIAEITRV